MGLFKKRFMIGAMLLSGCAQTYTKQEIDTKFRNISIYIQKTRQDADVLTGKVFAKELALSKKLNCSVNINTGKCLDKKK